MLHQAPNIKVEESSQDESWNETPNLISELTETELNELTTALKEFSQTIPVYPRQLTQKPVRKRQHNSPETDESPIQDLATDASNDLTEKQEKRRKAVASSSREYRKKQKEYVKGLEGKVKTLQEEIEELSNINQILFAKIEVLHQQLAAQKAQPVYIITDTTQLLPQYQQQPRATQINTASAMELTPSSASLRSANQLS